MSIWKMPIPPKIKMLLWRAVREVLPTKCNLLRRKVMCENCCPMCDGNPKNEWYVFFACTHVVQVWEADGLLQEVTAVMDTAESF